MALKALLRGFKAFFQRISDWSEEPEEAVYITGEEGKEQSIDEIHSVWDCLKFTQNTQAFHLSSVLGFDEWVDMEEIRRRIKELFGAEYKNERSLYPYLKTMTDIGLMESSSVGGRKQWRKHDLIVKTDLKKESKKAVVEAAASKKEFKKKQGQAIRLAGP